MGQQASYFLVPATGALCIQPVDRGIYGQEIQIKNFEGLPAQKWLIEPGSGDNIAFKNVGSGKYLHAAGARDHDKLREGEKQWWTLERGRAPNSVWVRCENGGYLCNGWGKHEADNTVFMWSSELDRNRQNLLWYVQDAGAWERNKGTKMNLALAAADAAGLPANQQHDQAQAQRGAALDAREKAVVEAEAEAKEREQKQAGLEAREAQALKRAQELATSRKTVREKLAKLKSEAEEAAKQQRQLEAERKAFAEKQTKLEAREKAIAEKEAAKSKRDGKDATSQLETLQKQNKELEEQLEQHQKEAHTSTASQEQVEKLQTELAQAHEQADFASSYEDRINQLEAELSTARKQLEAQQQQTQQTRQQQQRTAPISITSNLRTQEFVREGRRSDQCAPIGMQSAEERARVGDRDLPPRFRTLGPAPGTGRERSPLRFSSGKGAGGFSMEDLGDKGGGAGGFGIGDLGKGMERLGRRDGGGRPRGGMFREEKQGNGSGRLQVQQSFSRLPRLT